MERLTARSPKNNMAYLIKVKPNEQVVESPYPNTLKAILESFNRLATYEDSGLSPEEVAELAKIVRCKDCFQYSQNTEYDEDWGGYCHKYDADKNDNDCCRYAEKKGEKNV